MITASNIDYLIEPLQFHYGDPEGTIFSIDSYRTALVNSVKYLARLWGAKYIVEVIDTYEQNVIRNPDYTFTSEPTPLIEPLDEYALVLAATVILKQVSLTSSSSAFYSWSTPDLSYTNSADAKVKSDLYKQAYADLNAFFKCKLGKSRKGLLLDLAGLYPRLRLIENFNDSL